MAMLTVVLLAYHYGPGQSGLARDAASQLIATARACEAKEDWRGAMEAYGEALGKLPGTDTATRWSLRLAQSKARMRSGELPESIADFEGLLNPKGAPDERFLDKFILTLGLGFRFDYTWRFEAGWQGQEAVNSSKPGDPRSIVNALQLRLIDYIR